MSCRQVVGPGRGASAQARTQAPRLQPRVLPWVLLAGQAHKTRQDKGCPAQEPPIVPALATYSAGCTQHAASAPAQCLWQPWCMRPSPHDAPPVPVRPCLSASAAAGCGTPGSGWWCPGPADSRQRWGSTFAGLSKRQVQAVSHLPCPSHSRPTALRLSRSVASPPRRPARIRGSPAPAC